MNYDLLYHSGKFQGNNVLEKNTYKQKEFTKEDYVEIASDETISDRLEKSKKELDCIKKQIDVMEERLQAKENLFVYNNEPYIYYGDCHYGVYFSSPINKREASIYFKETKRKAWESDDFDVDHDDISIIADQIAKKNKIKIDSKEYNALWKKVYNEETEKRKEFWKKKRRWNVSFGDTGYTNFSISKGFLYSKKYTYQEAMRLAQEWIAFGKFPDGLLKECTQFKLYKP